MAPGLRPGSIRDLNEAKATMAKMMLQQFDMLRIAALTDPDTIKFLVNGLDEHGRPYE